MFQNTKLDLSFSKSQPRLYSFGYEHAHNSVYKNDRDELILNVSDHFQIMF